MAVAEVAGKEEGKRLRLELEGVRKKLEATEGTLSRKEVCAGSASRPSRTMDRNDIHTMTVFVVMVNSFGNDDGGGDRDDGDGGINCSCLHL